MVDGSYSTLQSVCVTNPADNSINIFIFYLAEQLLSVIVEWHLPFANNISVCITASCTVGEVRETGLSGYNIWRTLYSIAHRVSAVCIQANTIQVTFIASVCMKTWEQK
jgi:hypothetical protein